MRTFINLVFFVVVVGLAVLAARGIKTNSTPSPSAPIPSPSLVIETSGDGTGTVTTASPTAATARELVVLESKGGAQRLVAIDLATKARKTLYTDADETLKIKQVGNLTGDGTEALVLMGEAGADFGGQLFAVRLDGSGGKTRLIEQFASPWPPVFSPDGQKIAYIFFSNAEADAGFSLVIANRDGGNKRELVRESQAITQPVFAPSGTEIAYFRSGSASGAGAVMAIKTSGGSPREIYSYTNRVPYDLAWAIDGTLVFIDGTGDAANLYELPKGAAEPAVVSTPAGAESRPAFSPDAAYLALAVLAGSSGTITTIERATDKTENLGSGSIVVGWREKGA